MSYKSEIKKKLSPDVPFFQNYIVVGPRRFSKIAFNIHGRCSTASRFWPLRNERRRLWKCTFAAFDRQTIGVAITGQSGVVPRSPRAWTLGLLFLWRAWKNQIIVEIVMTLFTLLSSLFLTPIFKLRFDEFREKKQWIILSWTKLGRLVCILPTAALSHLAMKR